MSHRPASLIAIIGVLLFSILGYVALQQYIDRFRSLSVRSQVSSSESDFKGYQDLPIVNLSDYEDFKHNHADGVPVDYLVRARHWPLLKPGYKVYLYKSGCIMNSRPQETCINEGYIALNWGEKEANNIATLADLTGLLAPIQSEDDAFSLAQFLSRPEFVKYFGMNYANLTKVPTDVDAVQDDSGFHLSEAAWARLDLPEPKFWHGRQNYYVQRAVFIPFGEKQIIVVKETITPAGEYTYDIVEVLHRGPLIPIAVKDF